MEILLRDNLKEYYDAAFTQVVRNIDSYVKDVPDSAMRAIIRRDCIKTAEPRKRKTVHDILRPLEFYSISPYDPDRRYNRLLRHREKGNLAPRFQFMLDKSVLSAGEYEEFEKGLKYSYFEELFMFWLVTAMEVDAEKIPDYFNEHGAFPTFRRMVSYNEKDMLFQARRAKEAMGRMFSKEETRMLKDYFGISANLLMDSLLSYTDIEHIHLFNPKTEVELSFNRKETRGFVSGIYDAFKAVINASANENAVVYMNSVLDSRKGDLSVWNGDARFTFDRLRAFFGEDFGMMYNYIRRCADYEYYDFPEYYNIVA